MKMSRGLSANKKNARLSTGPKTIVGKERSANNALRHGLAIPIALDPVYDPAIAQLTGLIAGAEVDPERVAHARRIAEAQMDLVRIRQARHSGEAYAARLDDNGGLLHDPRFERYERRARSRRKAAIRSFDMNLHPNPGRDECLWSDDHENA